jgi:hypothetical protein
VKKLVTKADSGDLPLPRYGHTSILHYLGKQTRIIVFGGYDQDGAATNELWALEVRHSQPMLIHKYAHISLHVIDR